MPFLGHIRFLLEQRRPYRPLQARVLIALLELHSNDRQMRAQLARLTETQVPVSMR
jgi:hypothetical protein